MYNFNSRVLRVIPFIFLIFGITKVLYTYFELKNREADFARKQAEVLNSYAVENRSYHQGLFLNGILELNEKNLPALPAFSSHIISENFSITRFGEVTISIGIVEFDKSFNSYDEILNLADKKMYEAKKSGKNTIVK